ncbi:hypothetical protein TRFO_32670 [Tritrichomonas foetus]|uniref:Uncharacterized protein n=1 Tax=Tritrichomonas foetus TaxID=1144522 RepID=A0A1J4JNI5_9EUKA|nr:hypothetical protein TRFO_32670 [Tritrichomonas foetus]|eukprot:OHT00643.1 hypothetical protein TRFO_32670 [Tritrichomonas foetus]
MDEIFPNIPSELSFCLSEKCLELGAAEDQLQQYHQQLSKDIDTFSLLSVHHEFRSPWVINRPNKRAHLEKIFSKNIPESDHLILQRNEHVLDFVKNYFAGRENSILHFMCDERVNAHKITQELHSCQIDLDVFVATFIIPALFGHFLNEKNVRLFIESVGQAFDSFSHDPDPFLLNFNDTFLCHVLKQFFFSPLVRTFCGEHFTVFYDFFAYAKRKTDAQYTKIQRFFQLFLSEFSIPLKGTSAFMHCLFRRITEKFENKKKVLLTVIFSSIILPMAYYPVIYGVLPINYNYYEESNDAIQKLKIYFDHLCGFKFDENIKETDLIDENIINRFVETLLEDIKFEPNNSFTNPESQLSNSTNEHKNDSNEQNNENLRIETNKANESFILPFSALVFLAKFEEANQAFNELNNSNPLLPLHAIIKIDLSNKKLDYSKSKNLQLIEKILNDENNSEESSPHNQIIKYYFQKNKITPEEIINEMNNLLSLIEIKLIDCQTKLHRIKQSINYCIKSIDQANSPFVEKIVNLMINDYTFTSDLKQKKQQMIKDSKAFCTFVLSHLDTFSLKNKWAKPLMSQIARKFHSKIMLHFPLCSFESDQLTHIDQKFLRQKMKVLSKLEETGIDDKVKKILNFKEIFTAAQTVVLQSCLLENQLESANQIVMSLNVVEDIFVFVFGVQPEANQLMPLLANLFILSPVPTPLSSGQWMKHFLKEVMEKRPKWFSDESMRPLEHYFRFNSWIIDILNTIDE